MPVTRALRPIPILPISQEEFASALWRAYEVVSGKPQESRPLKMKWGIAVSGGVDSMSAAYLCARMQEQDPTKPYFKAFVVDHSARKESNGESERVMEKLQALGITGLDAHRLILTWPEHVADPLRLTNFETVARRMRFRALGHACAKHNIKSLILGHHANDVVETAVFRLLKGGFYDVANDTGHIPECKGIPFVDNYLKDSSDCESLSHCRRHDGPLTAVQLADQGVTIYKPLQQFGKERLVETCLRNQVAWVEDRTNQDPSLTTRNAIRFLFSRHTVPPALQDVSLYNLAKDKSKVWKDANARAMAYMHRIDGSFDLPSGILSLNFPNHEGGQQPIHQFIQTMSALGLKRVLAEEVPIGIALVKHITRMVQPYSVLGNEKMKRILTRLLETTRSSENSIARKVFNLGNIQWCFERGPRGCSWQMYRQQPARGTHTLCPEWTVKDFGEWKLFDDRFWIRIARVGDVQSGNLVEAKTLSTAADFDHTSIFQTGLQSGLEVRLLGKEDLSIFRRNLRCSTEGKKTLKIMDHVLSARLPGNSRWTLPVIAVKGRSNLILGFATMNWHLQGVQKWFRWEAQYAYTFVPETYLFVDTKQEDRESARNG